MHPIATALHVLYINLRTIWYSPGCPNFSWRRAIPIALSGQRCNLYVVGCVWLEARDIDCQYTLLVDVSAYRLVQ